jgi:hypothetical protein
MEKSCDKCVHCLPEKIVKEYLGCVYCEKIKGYMRSDSATVCKLYDEESTSEPEPKADKGKTRLTLVPPKIIWNIAKVRQYGVEVKYPETGVDGWRGIGEQRIRDAMCRHLMRYLADPKGLDEESGLPHLWHLACNVAFLCELEEDNGKTGEEKIKQ